jgi:hypothetical protein
LVDWIAYSRIEPFGFEMENWRMGLLAATVANSVPRPRGSKALKPEDFLPKTNVRASGLTSRQEHELKERAKRNRKK